MLEERLFFLFVVGALVAVILKNLSSVTMVMHKTKMTVLNVSKWNVGVHLKSGFKVGMM